MHNLAWIEEGLRATFPELGPLSIRTVLGEGFRSIAVDTDAGLVFRVGKHAFATDGYAKESRLLPTLQSYLPLFIPNPRWYSGPCDRFPYGVTGYKKLPGEPLDPRHLPGGGALIAIDLGRFLAALHNLPTQELVAIGLPGPHKDDDSLTQMQEAV